MSVCLLVSVLCDGFVFALACSGLNVFFTRSFVPAIVCMCCCSCLFSFWACLFVSVCEESLCVFVLFALVCLCSSGFVC